MFWAVQLCGSFSALVIGVLCCWGLDMAHTPNMGPCTSEEMETIRNLVVQGILDVEWHARHIACSFLKMLEQQWAHKEILAKHMYM